MRLICPNCGAQYEVPDGVVPQEGRDVQCSNCGNTWFQAHPDHDQALTDELHQPQVEEPDQSDWSDPQDDDIETGEADAPQQSDASDRPDWDTPDADEDEWQGFDERSQTSSAAEIHQDDPIEDLDADLPETTSVDQDTHAADTHDDRVDHSAGDDDRDAGNTDDDPESAPKEDLKARELDPSIADILQQEAAHEAQARAADTSLESQPDLGLEDATSDADQRAKEASERMARLRGDAPLEEAVAATVAASSRADLLPDIDEINSTLRSTSDRKSGVVEETYDEDYSAPRKSGRFRRGFWMIVLAALVLLLLYVFSPQIMKALPALDGVMTSYVAMVDQLRVWFDGQLKSVLQWLDTKASASGQ